jgi:hypothetical protein
VVTVFIPPPILQEVQPVFEPPMVANMLEQFGRSHLTGVEAGNEVTHVVRQHDAIAATHDAIDAQR